ncbi:Aste57867_21347 [Aphanomyces stellatus]|uniref:Aste57867_21347 protein n=1 Tax=Aphanomyces stellatus TaxID=120398 RepID=A0A485LH82_9STRA|nr:hypothetical protein As57867_021278 [Aphanomyces stellatus]VFT98019.1 Aste57867_21347 [Aphanomyces stellatus]
MSAAAVSPTPTATVVATPASPIVTQATPMPTAIPSMTPVQVAATPTTATVSPTTTNAPPTTTAAATTTVASPTPTLTTSNPAIQVACLNDMYECSNGQFVSRDPANDCKFFPCRDAENNPAPKMTPTTAAPTSSPTTAAPSTSAPSTTSLSASPSPSANPTTLSSTKTHRAASNWTAIDDAIPADVVQTIGASFLDYNRSGICDSFGVGISTAERATLSNSSLLYNVVLDVNCSLAGVNQTTGRYVVQLASGLTAHGGLLLTQCGVLENGTLTNWMGVHGGGNGATYCQTPAERREYVSQPMEHAVHADEKTPVSSLVGDLTNLMQQPTVWHLFAISVCAILALAVVFAVVMGRRRIEEQKRRQMERSILEEVATGRIQERMREAAAREAARLRHARGDAPSPRDNPLGTDKAKREIDDSVFTIDDEDETDENTVIV